MDEEQKKIKEQIDLLMLGFGALCEFLGYMREQLTKNGFSREEAIAMCTVAMTSMITPKKGNENDK